MASLIPWTADLDSCLPGGPGEPLQLPPLDVLERPAATGKPVGAIVLLHGRGADEHDLFPLLETLDPHAQLHGVCVGAPFAMPGEPGRHWYRLSGIPTPHAPTFLASLTAIRTFLADLERRINVPTAHTIVGGFSQGCVMATAATLFDGGRRPAALLALSGFFPRVGDLGIERDLVRDLPVVVGHGTADDVIDARFGHDLAHKLADAGARVAWEPSQMSHSIDPSMLVGLRPWIEAVVSPDQLAALHDG